MPHTTLEPNVASHYPIFILTDIVLIDQTWVIQREDWPGVKFDLYKHVAVSLSVCLSVYPFSYWKYSTLSHSELSGVAYTWNALQFRVSAFTEAYRFWTFFLELRQVFRSKCTEKLLSLYWGRVFSNETEKGDLRDLKRVGFDLYNLNQF